MEGDTLVEEKELEGVIKTVIGDITEIHEGLVTLTRNATIVNKAGFYRQRMDLVKIAIDALEIIQEKEE